MAEIDRFETDLCNVRRVGEANLLAVRPHPDLWEWVVRDLKSGVKMDGHRMLESWTVILLLV